MSNQQYESKALCEKITKKHEFIEDKKLGTLSLKEVNEMITGYFNDKERMIYLMSVIGGLDASEIAFITRSNIFIVNRALNRVRGFLKGRVRPND